MNDSPGLPRHGASSSHKAIRVFSFRGILSLWAALLLAGYDGAGAASAANGPAANASAALPASVPNSPPLVVTNYTYEVVHVYPHDPRAFTQGLLFHDGKLLESAGLYGQSSLREVDLTTGVVLRKWLVPGQYFAEGLALLDDKLYQLTWKEERVFVYDLKSDSAAFHKVAEFPYAGEGWGLATAGRWLIMSDGTSTIRFVNPTNFAVHHAIQVMRNGEPQDRLNELEYVRGEIFANIWQTDWVARIDPATGSVTGMMDFGYLLPAANRNSTTDVLNGIAYDAAGDRLFVTGKNWPLLFEVRLKRK
jgi:glutamine cyclotransferase